MSGLESLASEVGIDGRHQSSSEMASSAEMASTIVNNQPSPKIVNKEATMVVAFVEPTLPTDSDDRQKELLTNLDGN
jgi:hypothetical protein